MAVKTFTAGEVLSASDTNTYLNNGGLVYITAATFSSSTELNLTSIFSATYDVYQLVFSNFVVSTGNQILLRMLSGTTPLTTNTYYNQRFYAQQTSVGGVGTGTTAVGNGILGFVINTQRSGATTIIYNPFLSTNTTMHTNVIYDAAGIEQNNTMVNNTTSYDGIRIYPTSGNMTGTVRVYGYRQA